MNSTRDTTLAREKELLGIYAQNLRAAQERADEALAVVNELLPIVRAMSARVNRLEGTGDEDADSAANEAPSELSVEHHPAGRTRGRRPLKTVLMDITANPGRWDVDAILTLLASTGDFDELPKRVSVTNRLNELVRDRYLISRGRGDYERLPREYSASGVESDGAAQTDPDRGVTPRDGEGLGESPSGGLDQPAGGSQMTGATTGVAGRP